MYKLSLNTLYQQFLDYSNYGNKEFTKITFNGILTYKFCIDRKKTGGNWYFFHEHSTLKLLVDPQSVPFKPFDFGFNPPKPVLQRTPEPEEEPAPTPEPEEEAEEPEESDEVDNLEDEDIDYVEEALKSKEVITSDFKRLKIKRVNC